MSATAIRELTTADGKVRLALNRREAATALGMSLTTFQRHVQGAIPAVYVGSVRLYRVADLERWLTDRMQ